MSTRVIFVFLLLLFADSESRAQRVHYTQPGDFGSGVVISEDQRQLRLDATPCLGTINKTILVFRSPYKKVPLGKANCGSTVYDKVQVIQN
jgi:hypothetical protein